MVSPQRSWTSRGITNGTSALAEENDSDRRFVRHQDRSAAGFSEQRAKHLTHLAAGCSWFTGLKRQMVTSGIAQIK
jgi:hypothetical protein